MSAFSKLTAAAKLSPRSIVTLPPSGFADTYSRRPSSPVKIGLRLVSEAELTSAQTSAAKAAWQAHPEITDREERLEIFNDYLMTNVLAQVCVNAEGGDLFFAPAPEAIIRSALVPGGIRHLWNAYQTLSIADGQLAPEASDEELKTLGSVIADGMAGLDAGSQTRVRRLVRAILDEVARAAPAGSSA